MIEYSKTEGINSYLFITDKQNHILEQFPKESPLFYSWDDWHTPVYTQRRKALYDTLQQYFSSKLVQKTKTEFPTNEKFEINDFYMDKKAAVSISFDEQSYSQYLFAYPELKKYGLTATFGLIPGRDDKKAFTAEYHHITDRRMGKNILKLLQKNRFELAITLPEKPDWETIIKNYSQTKTLHTGNSIKTKIPGRFIFVRQNKTTQYKGVKYHFINSHTSPKHLWEALMQNSGSWSIVNYKYLFKDSLSVKKISKEILAQNYVSLDQFKREIRLIRNTNYWIDTEQNIFKYLFEKQHIKLISKRFGEVLFIQAKTNLNTNVFNMPLTIRFETPAKILKLTGSQQDGIYENRTGSILINLLPGKEVRIEKIK
jgi:hypothetical protein